MIAVVVKCGKNDYMVIDDREWSSFNNSIKSLSGSDKKNRTYQIGDRNFTYKETKKFKHFKEEDVWVKTSQYVNIDGEKYEPGTYHLKCIHNAIQLVY